MTVAVGEKKKMAENKSGINKVLPHEYGCEILLEKTTIEKAKDSLAEKNNKEKAENKSPRTFKGKKSSPTSNEKPSTDKRYPKKPLTKKPATNSTDSKKDSQKSTASNAKPKSKE